jgi:hypothetical protein
MRPRQDTVPDDPDVVRGREEGGFRDETTAPAETRTHNLGVHAPWLMTPDAPPREVRPRDPLLVPVLVFVGVLVAAIGYMLASQPPRRGSAGEPTLAPVPRVLPRDARARRTPGTSSARGVSQGSGRSTTTSRSLRKHCVFRQDGPTWRSPTIPTPG